MYMLTCTRYLNPSISDILNLYGLTDRSLSPRQDKYNDSIKQQLYMYMHTCTCTCTHVHTHVYIHTCTYTLVHVYTVYA